MASSEKIEIKGVLKIDEVDTSLVDKYAKKWGSTSTGGGYGKASRPAYKYVSNPAYAGMKPAKGAQYVVAGRGSGQTDAIYRPSKMSFNGKTYNARNEGFTGNVQSVKKYNSALSGLKSTMSSVAKVAGKVGTSLGKSLGRVALGGIQKAVQGVTGKLNGLISGLLRIAKYRVFRYAVSQITAGFGDGLTDITNYSNALNGMDASSVINQMNTLASCALYVKNALGAVLAPVINAITPYVYSMANAFATACNKLAEFFAMLNGSGTFTKAKFAQTTTEKLEDIGSSASSANDSAKELQRTLMGFDEINRLDAPDSGSSGSGGGSGSGSSTPAYTEMFEEASVGILDMSAYDIGANIAEALNKAMDSIDWDSIQEKASQVAYNLAMGINGFIETFDWHLLGETISNGLNTALYSATTFLENLNWKELGNGLMTSIISFIANIDWSEVGTLISDGIGAVLDFADGILTAISDMSSQDETEIANAITDFLEGIDWTGVISKAIRVGFDLGEALDRIIQSLPDVGASLITGLISAIFGDDAGEKFAEKWEEIKGYWQIGINGLLTALLPDGFTQGIDLAQWLFQNEDGEYGLSGVTEKLGRFGEFVERLFGETGDEATLEWGDTTIKISDLGETLKTNLTTKWQDLKTNTKKFFSETGEDATLEWNGTSIKISEIGETIKNAMSEKIETAKNKVVDKFNELKSKAETIFNEIKTKITTKVDEIKNKIPSMGDMIESVKTKFNDFKDNISTTIQSLKDKITTKVDEIKTKIGTIASPFTTAWTKISNFKDNVVSAMTKVKNAITNSGGTFKLPHVSWGTKAIASSTAVGKALDFFGVSRSIPWPSISWYARGGFPEMGQLFMARENGAEMVGSMNGRAGVANNEQIVEGIKRGVYEAMTMANGGSNDITVNVDGRKLFQFVVDQNNSTVRRTGASPLLV